MMDTIYGVLLVDDDTYVRTSLGEKLHRAADLTCVGACANGREALEFLASPQGAVVDVVVMDLAMPELDGLEATRLITERYPHARVFVLTSFDDPERVERALAAGAAGYTVKTTPTDTLLDAVRAIGHGYRVLGGSVPHALNSHQEARQRLGQLNERDRATLFLITQGCDNGEIAQRLFVSVSTVKSTVKRLSDAFGCSNRVQLAVAATRLGADLEADLPA